MILVPPPSNTELLERDNNGQPTGKMSANWVRWIGQQFQVITDSSAALAIEIANRIAAVLAEAAARTTADALETAARIAADNLEIAARIAALLLYQLRSEKNQPSGYVGLDANLIPFTDITNAQTAALVTLLNLIHRSSGVPAAGFGVSAEFSLHSSANVLRAAAFLDALWTTATDTNESADLVFRLMAGGAAAAEMMRLTSRGNLGIGVNPGSSRLYVSGGLSVFEYTALNATCTEYLVNANDTSVNAALALIIANVHPAINALSGFTLLKCNSAFSLKPASSVQTSLSNVTPGAEAGFIQFATLKAGTGLLAVALLLDGNQNASLAGKIILYNNAAPTDGQLLIGNTAGARFDAATLTPGLNIGIANAGGAITISLSGIVLVASGGTGSNTAAGARASLNAAQIQAPGGPHTIPLAKLTGGGANGSITFNAEGVVTGFLDPT